jgi:hypothetical protein
MSRNSKEKINVIRYKIRIEFIIRLNDSKNHKEDMGSIFNYKSQRRHKAHQS